MQKFFSRILLAFFLLSLFAGAFAVIPDSSMNIFAVMDDGKAIDADLILRIEPGNGMVWSSVRTLVGTSTQTTERIAVELAKNYYKNVGGFDYKFDINSSASLVEGPSAGAAMALLVISSLQDKKVPAFVGLTGTINSDGSIGPVGGVFEKSRKASQIGIKLFMVPQGEAQQIVKLPDGVKSIDLTEYAEKEWGMKVVEVANIDDALKFAFINPADLPSGASAPALPEFVPIALPPNDNLVFMKEINADYIKEAERMVGEAQTALSGTTISDPAILDVLLSTLNSSKTLVDRAKISFEQNYFYSSANFAFLAQINASLVYDVAANPGILSGNSTVFSSKVSDLNEKIAALKRKLGQSISVSSVEWQVSAMQRLAYAENNVRNLLNPETIVVTVGEGSDQYAAAFQKINDLEFAVAWYNVADDLYSKTDKENHRVKLDDRFSKDLDSALAELEKKMSSLPDSELEDIQRRHDTVVLEKSSGWYIAGLFDAKTAIAFVDAFNDSEGKSLDELLPMLDEKIGRLEKRMLDGNVSVAWPRLYFDHAKYYLDAAKFYRQQGQLIKASDNAKSGLSLVYLADNLYGLTVEADSYYAGLSESAFVPEPSASPASKPLQPFLPFGLNVSGFLMPLLVILVVLILAILLAALFPFARLHDSAAANRKRIDALKGMQLELDKRLLAGKISKPDYWEMHLKFEREILASGQALLAESRRTVELENIRAELSALQGSVHSLRADYRKGFVVRPDFERNLKQKSARIAELSSSLDSVAAGKPSKKRWPQNTKKAVASKNQAAKRKNKKRK
ncbi:MAG: hypothetical protein HY394_02180 [Candidatus Diapherotrites archaeon]|nr:hypothetical protein [Candidatus Diapherotrites archaeon]